MLNKFLKFAAVLALSAFITSIGYADTEPQILYDNMSASTIYDEEIGSSDLYIAGQSFTSGTDSYQFLSELDLKLAKISDNEENNGTYTVELWSSTEQSSSGTPDSIIAQIGTQTIASLSETLDTVSFTNLNIQLAGSTMYYITLSTYDETFAGRVSWGIEGSAASEYIGAKDSVFSYAGIGGSFSDPSGTVGLYPQLMKITSVPEPSTCALGLLGSLMAAFGRARRRT